MKIEKKITINDLNLIISHANDNFRDDSHNNLDSKQFVAQCYLKAITMLLNIEGLEYPTRKNTESIDDL